METIRLVSAEQVQSLLRMDQLIQEIEIALAEYSKRSTVVQPVRSVVVVENAEKDGEDSCSKGYFGVMPVYASYNNVLACKLVSFYPDNRKIGRDTHLANIMLYDAKCGELKAIMDGGVITAMRTAAASAVASKYLVSTSVQQRKLAVLGAGTQARSHVKALKELFSFSKISIWSATMESAFKCAEEVDGEACLTAQEAVDDADIIVTATFSEIPILKRSWVKKGAHINAVGACRPDHQEIDPELMRDAQVYVDSKEAAMKESGDVILSQCEIYAEIGEVINGDKKPERELTTLFKSLGMGVEDAVSAKLVYDAAIASKL